MNAIRLIAGSRVHGKVVPLTVDACRHCLRADCPLLADVIRGRLSYARAVYDCIRASKGG